MVISQPAVSDQHRHYALLAEDDYAFRWALAIELERNGFDLDVAENGVEAIEILEKTQRHCCLIVDLRMPQLSGVELIGRAQTLRPDLPVVTVTAFPEDLPLLRPSPFSTVLRKPVATDDVCRAAAAACRTLSRHS